MRTHLELRDRSLVDVLDLALRFMRQYAKKYGKLSAAVILPWFAICCVIGIGIDWGLAWVVAIVAGAFAQAPFTLLASRLVFEDKVPLSSVMSDGLRSIPKMLGVRLVQALLVTVGMLGVVVASIWVGSVVMYAPEAALLERMTPGASISRANRLVGGSSGDGILAFVLLLMLEIGFVLIGEYAGRSVLEDLLQINPPASMWDAGGSWLAMAGFWIFVPYRATARFLAYINLRTRAEGWDVQTSFFTLAARAKDDEDPAPISRRAA